MMFLTWHVSTKFGIMGFMFCMWLRLSLYSFHLFFVDDAGIHIVKTINFQLWAVFASFLSLCIHLFVLFFSYSVPTSQSYHPYKNLNVLGWHLWFFTGNFGTVSAYLRSFIFLTHHLYWNSCIWVFCLIFCSHLLEGKRSLPTGVVCRTSRWTPEAGGGGIGEGMAGR